MRFTDRSIAALKPKADRYEVWEDGRTGFGVRVAPSGRKSWLYMYRFEGKARRMTLGNYPKLTLSKARVLLAKAKKRKDHGEDPGKAHVERRRDERAAHTVSALIDEYLERHARPNKRSHKADERALKKEVVPVWGSRKALSIRRRDVITLLDGLVERGSPVMANRLLGMLRRMFAFAVERDILDASPCVGVKAPTKETARERVLTQAEIKAFWNGLHKAEMSELTRLALKLMLVTAQRREEVVCAPRSEFNLQGNVWEIPGARTKTGNAHRVPLSPLAVELVEAAIAAGDEIHNGCDWLFPSPKKGKPMSAAAVSHAVRRNFLTEAPKSAKGRRAKPKPEKVWPGVGRFTPHDLRRTGASHMTEIGIPRLIVSKILGHADSSTTAVYDRFEYWPEKQSAMNAWANRLYQNVTGKLADGKVVALRPT